MKFVYGEFPDDEGSNPELDGDWKVVVESDNLWVVQLQAVSFLVFNYMTIMIVYMIMDIEFEFDTLDMIISFLILIPIHEFIHALIFPESIISENVGFGFIPKGVAFFAFYFGEMSRSRFIGILLAPLTIMTLIGLIILVIIKDNSILEHIILYNSLVACVDCFGAYMIMKQVPANATVRNKKNKTYWKVD